jgi:hypothetical protein
MKRNPDSESRNTRWEELLAQAARVLPDYLAATEGLSHESKGIRRSELFFCYALIAPLRPVRIIESGRARAQSTLVFSLLFPDALIVSLESDPNSPDAAIAAQRLQDRDNVECRFGDSLVVLPELAGEGDMVVIDGPKDFRALKLALTLLSENKIHGVFVHDLWLRSPAREFVERHLPSAMMSDDSRWVEAYARLDSARPLPPVFDPGKRRAYGATMGYLAAGLDNYKGRLTLCRVAQARERVQATVRKWLRHPAPARPRDFEEA